MLHKPLPADYVERVYAGVLGKMIGVYLGRPFEGWTYERIMAELGEITGYVNEKRGMPLVITDDDLSGTFTFLRALEDYGYSPDLTPAQIGQTWLNYIIEGRTILWWGGLGNSTEHTAYLRLKRGIAAPRSGSIELNSKVVAEQIGAQIFIDGWAMVAPGDPALAADLAWRAGSVSHDGEAVYAAQVLAAMEAQAFVEADINKLLDVGISFIPQDSITYRLIQDVREWHREEPDWRKARERIEARYGYDRYGGNCHVIPNHALIVMALLYGEDNFHKSLLIVNTSGWDTDCNSGNVGCLLGIKNGLRALESGPDWRGPVADRLYVAAADGGRVITDAVNEAYHIARVGHALAGVSYVPPKDGARFNFALPGSVQGFQLDAAESAQGDVILENVEIRSGRALALRYKHLGQGQSVCVTTPTFIPPDAIDMVGYGLMASPTLYAGQTVRAALLADQQNGQPVSCRLLIRTYGANDQLSTVQGPEVSLAPGSEHAFVWRVPDTGGAPIAAVGLELLAAQDTQGSIYLDYLTWDGAPNVELGRPATGGTLWRRAWIDALDQFEPHWPETYRLIQNEGRGMLIQGTREWQDYRVSATLTPHMVEQMGLGARVQGLRRYYALMLTEQGQARLIKELDGEKVLAEAAYAWELDRPYALTLQVVGARIQGWIDGQPVFDVQDRETPLSSGAVALICQEGHAASEAVIVQEVAE